MYETSSIQKTFTNNMYCYILISFKKIIILTVGLIFCLLFYFISVHGKPGVREGENVSEETGGELHTQSCIVASIIIASFNNGLRFFLKAMFNNLTILYFDIVSPNS